jgi:hypothetical protein
VRCGGRGGGRIVLAKLLDLLDLAGQLVSESLLQRLQWTRLVISSASEWRAHAWVLPVE